jgi:hypothetical protein
MSTTADEELIDLSEDTSLKLNFNCKKLTQFWLSNKRVQLFLLKLEGTAPFFIFVHL